MDEDVDDQKIILTIGEALNHGKELSLRPHHQAHPLSAFVFQHILHPLLI